MRIVAIALALVGLVGLAKSQAVQMLEDYYGSLPQLLLMRPEVKEELKITAEETQKMEDIWLEETKKPPAEIHGSKAEAERAYKTQTQLNDKLVAVLDTKQRKRIRELKIQSIGVNALLVSEVKKELGLKEKQSKAIEGARMKAMKATGTTNRSQKDYEAKIAKIERTYDAAALKVLTPAQAKKFKAMNGKLLKGIHMRGLPGL